jgi:hypothetical protein
MTETNFKELWQAQNTTSNTDSKEIVLKAKHLQRKTRIKLLLSNLLLFATMLFIIGVVLYFKPQMITTKIGTILVLIAIIMQIATATKLITLIKESDTQTSNVEYLNQLLIIKIKQAVLQSSIMALYFILLGLGLALYMFEYVLRMTLLDGLLTYGITGLWIAFNWFYLKPKIIKKQQQKLNDSIAALENMNNQFKEEE